MQASKSNVWLYRYALLVAVCTLILIGSGAFLTTSRKISEAAAQSAVVVGSRFVDTHLMALVATVGMLSFGLAVVVFLTERRWMLRTLSCAVVVIFGLEGWTALQASAAAIILHACLAPLLFSTLAAICVLLSPGWAKGSELIADTSRGWLQILTIAAPAAVLLQIALGAAYRHKVTSIMPHMAGAMLASLLTLVSCTVILQQCPAHRTLRAAATAVLSIVLLQVTLGVTAFIMELLDAANTSWFVIATVSHVLVGSLTLAFTVVLAIQAHRNIEKVAEESVSATV